MIRDRSFLTRFFIGTSLFMWAANADAVTIWSEPVNGDLSTSQSSPTALGTLSLGNNSLYLDDSGSLYDRDYFTFTVPPGHVLDQFQLSGFSSSNLSGFVSIGLGTGTVPSQGSSVEFINWNRPDRDLLQFDSKPGPQPPGDYVVSLSYFRAATTDYSLWTTAVIDIPEPSSIGLFLFGSVVAFCWHRNHTRRKT